MNSDQQAQITMYGADWCGDCRRASAFFKTEGIAFEYVDLIAHPEAADIAREISGKTNIPVIVFRDGSHLVEPSNQQLREHLAALSA